MPELLEVIGSQSRWKILQILSKGPKDLRHLSAELQMSAQGVMKHLKVLEETGLVRVKSENGRQEYALSGRVWLNRQSRPSYDIIVFFSSKEWNKELPLSDETAFRAHRLVRRLANCLKEKAP